MTSFSSAGDAASDARQWRWQGNCGARWKPFEIAAMVIAFAIYWPIGLALLGLKIAQRRGYTFDDAYASAKSTFTRTRASNPARQWRPFSSGNAAFDEWRDAELAKLDEERRKLDAAHREFAEHLDNLRRARDRAEFDAFMSARSQSKPTA